MNQSEESYISNDMIVSEIAKKSGDKEYKYESPGYYTSLVQEALTELSFDTFFLEKEKVYDITPGCLKYTLPSGFFNVREIYLINGDVCHPSAKQNVWWHRNYANGISKSTKNQNDPFFVNNGKNPPSNLYFCGIRNGVIDLSQNCAGYQKLIVRANGLLCDIGDVPCIPSFFRSAVVDYGVVGALSIRIAEVADPAKIQAWQYILNLHNQKLTRPYDGSWDKAMHRAKTMDRKSREDLKEYLAKFDSHNR